MTWGILVMMVVVILKPLLTTAGNFKTKVDSSNLKTCGVINGLLKNQIDVNFLIEIKPQISCYLIFDENICVHILSA